MIDWLVIVGEQPASPRPEGFRRPPTLVPWWSIYRTLDRWFRAAGFGDGDLRRINFRNVLPEHVGSPTAAQLAEGRERLIEELWGLRPEVVVTLGRVAARAMGVPQGHQLDRDCGRVYSFGYARVTPVDGESPSVRGFTCQVLPLPHPSGQNRLLNGPGGQLALGRGIVKLQEMREEHGG